MALVGLGLVCDNESGRKPIMGGHAWNLGTRPCMQLIHYPVVAHTSFGSISEVLGMRTWRQRTCARRGKVSLLCMCAPPPA